MGERLENSFRKTNRVEPLNFKSIELHIIKNVVTVVAQINTDYTVRKQQTTIVYINKKTDKHTTVIRNLHVNWLKHNENANN